jgi:leader peptidase (prepilin peptidase)/N-methyltransferase
MSLQTLEVIGYIITGIIVFLFGITIGSFLNVCIYRLPKGESLIKRNSHCMTCGTEIKRYDLIPILSWLLLRGKCRACGAKISPRYMLVESLTGVMFVLAMIRYDIIQYGFYFVILCLFFAGLIVICFEDFDTQNMSVSVLIYLFAVAGIERIIRIISPDSIRYEEVSLSDALIGTVSVSVPFLIFGFVITPLVYSLFVSEDHKSARKLKNRISRMKKEKASDKEIEKIQKILDKHLDNIKEAGPVYGFGMGDIILMAAGGLLLGWKASIVAAFAAIIIGAVYGLIRKHFDKGESNAFAFGPFLTIGLAFAAFFGNYIFNAYVDFITVPKV